jgi:FG-GAP-like repeat
MEAATRRVDGRRSPYLTALVVGVVVLTCAGGLAGAAPGPFKGTIYVLQSWPKSVAIADVTGDRRGDVLVTTAFRFDEENDFKLFVFQQGSDGSLLALQRLATHGVEDQSPQPMGVATGDLDGDGATDAAVATHGGVDVYSQRQGRLEHAALISGTAGADQVEIADLDGNGTNDLIITARQPGTWPIEGRLLVANNTGDSFAVSTVHSGRYHEDIALGDLNSDGRHDIVGYPTPLNVFLQGPNGEWLPRAYLGDDDLTPYALSTGEFTGDGKTDVALGHGQNSGVVLLYAQTPTGELAAPTRIVIGDEPEGMDAADLDADGRDDLVYYHDGNPSFPVAIGALLQEQPGELTPDWYPLGLFPANHLPHRGLDVGDVDNNGTADLVFADYNEGLVVLRQEGSTTPPPPPPEPPPAPGPPPPAEMPAPPPPASSPAPGPPRATRDVTPPNTRLRTWPSRQTRSRRAFFRFVSSEAGSRFFCKLDRRRWTRCGSPAIYLGLRKGPHLFRVRAVDRTGNADATPARRWWRIR